MTAKPKDHLLPILAIVLSALALSDNLIFTNIPEFIISIVGIAAGVTFFVKRDYFYPLIQVWIYGQFPAINRTITTTLENGVTFEQLQPILDAGQMLTFDLGFAFGTSFGEIDIKVNIVPFAFLFLLKFLQSSALIGKKLTIKDFKKENKLGNIFPLTGVVKNTLTLGKEKHWFHAELDNPFNFNGKSYQNLLIRSKEELIYKPGKGKYISYLRLVEDPNTLKEDKLSKDRYPFIDWGQVEVEK